MQIVGWSDSGKTVLTEKLLTYFQKKGVVCGTIKHHGKQEKLGLDQGNTDTAKHRRAGARSSLLTGAGESQLNVDDSLSMVKMLRLHLVLETELLLIEGFKQEKFPKIIVFDKNKQISGLNNVCAAVGPSATGADFSWETLEKEMDTLGEIVWKKSEIIS
ncbi:molybdopterin-guanine dinucleotide biosynthesis protein B [Alkalicoccus halolimnae]|uniref:Molybdopterin-guanine dinucleotide biosynthesis protein B n=1 Tax=Alkalicoccus halolimnae TaxID=1667239 RepID=A0AAJ8LZ69_9BACI|nr:molybdopterin-guanine dinucleotide biosynthesis protein B [Alkalicoccus halolimnae]